MKALALKWRLALPVAVAVAVAMLIILVMVYETFEELVLTERDRSLLAAGRAVQMVLDDAPLNSDRENHIRSILSAMIGRPDDEDHPQLVFKVWLDADAGHAVVIGAAADVQGINATLSTMKQPDADGQASFDADTQDDDYRGVWLKVTAFDGAANIVVAQSTREVYGELHEFLWGFALASLGVVLCVVLMSGLLIMLGLRPIRLTAEMLAGVTANNLGQLDWSAHAVPRELESFVQTIARMLERLNAAIQQQRTFVADAAHELRTPLAIAKSTLQVAQTSDSSLEECRRALGEATDDLRRLERLVNDLLTLARLEDGGAGLYTQELNLTSLLEELLERYESRVKGAGGTLQSQIDRASIKGDATQLSRLFSNLVENALRYGPKGGTIRLTAESRAGYVDVHVQDQGGGISPKDIPHLFDRFYRVDESRSSDTGGVGLGLAIAKAIVLRHNGTISIDSNPTAGTCVTVRFPLAH